MPTLSNVYSAVAGNGEVTVFASQHGTGQNRHGIYVARLSTNGTASSYHRMTQSTADVVAAHVNEQGALEVFTAGGGSDHFIQGGIGSSQWSPAAAQFNANNDTVLLAWPSNRLELFRVSGSQVQQRWESGTSGQFVSYWQTLQGTPAPGGLIGAASIDGHPFVVLRDSSAYLWVCSISSGWRTWYPLGGNVRGGARPNQRAVVGNRSDGTFVAAHLDPHGHVWFWDHREHKWHFLNGGGFTELAMLQVGGRVWLLALDADGQVVHRTEKSVLGGFSWPWASLGAPGGRKLYNLQAHRDSSGHAHLTALSYPTTNPSTADYRVAWMHQDSSGNMAAWQTLPLA